MLHDSADQSLLAPAPAYERDNIAGTSRPVSPISIASTITAVGNISANTSTTSFATFKARDVPPNDDWRPKIKGSKHIFQWWPEILAAATSIISFIAMIIVLRRIDGTRLDQWRMFWKIQPSAVISVLITLCQMSLTPVIAEALSQLKWIYFEQRPQRLSDFEIFDEASRGPWGSMRLAYRLKWRASVASGGALLAVLALGMGPFTQQVLYTQVQHTQLTNVSAEIDASPFYNSGSLAAFVGPLGAQADHVASSQSDSSSTISTLGASTLGTSMLSTSTLSTSTLSTSTSVSLTSALLVLESSISESSTPDTSTSDASTSASSTAASSTSASSTTENSSTSEPSTSGTSTDDSSTFSTSATSASTASASTPSSATPSPSTPSTAIPSQSTLSTSTLGPSTPSISPVDTSTAFSTSAPSTSALREFILDSATLVTSTQRSQTQSGSSISSSSTSSTSSTTTPVPSSGTTILSSPVSSITVPDSLVSTSATMVSSSISSTSTSSSSTLITSVRSTSTTIVSSSSSSSSTTSESIPTPNGYAVAPGYGFGEGSKVRRRGQSQEAAQPESTACADSWMVQAAYAGLFASSPDNTFSCPNGNCTYPTFTSLGVCSRCNDLTSSVSPHCNGAAVSGQNCTFTLPGKETINGHDIVLTANSTCGTRIRSGTSWQSRVLETIDTESPEILTFYSLRLPTTYRNQAECISVRPTIRKCSMAWCAKTYTNSSVVNGQLKTQTIHETPLVESKSKDTSCPALESIAAPTSADNIPWRSFVRQDRACPSIGPDDVFWVNRNDHDTTRNMFTAMLENQEYALGVPDVAMAFSQMATLQAFVNNNNGDLGKTLGNISTSMTNLVRSAMPAQRIQGIPSTTAIVYKVGWWWLLYPLAIIVLAITFFIVTIMLSGEKSRIIWKSSSLAVLSHGLDGFDPSELESHNLKGMSKEAKGLRARLQMNEEGKLKLVRCGP